jgi:hypothetical protein
VREKDVADPSGGACRDHHAAATDQPRPGGRMSDQDTREALYRAFTAGAAARSVAPGPWSSVEAAFVRFLDAEERAAATDDTLGGDR